MASLRIDLQEGFSEDEVVITVDGSEVFRGEGVTTDYSIGLARSVELEVPVGPVEVGVEVPTADLSETIALEVSTETHLAVAKTENGITYQREEEGFRYL